jgi:hypothetical protein
MYKEQRKKMYIQPLISFLLILFFSSSLSHAQAEPQDSLHNQDIAKIFGSINQQDWNNQVIPACLPDCNSMPHYGK